MCTHRGNPNMNSLIGLGALTSFAAGLASPLAPGVAFDTSFLEEPVMLLAFVLLGRSLEARARLKASGATLHLLPCCTSQLPAGHQRRGPDLPSWWCLGARQ